MKRFFVAITTLAIAAVIYAAIYAMPFQSFGMFAAVAALAIASSVNPGTVGIALLYAAVMSRPGKKSSVAASGFAYAIGIFAASIVSGAALLSMLVAIGGIGALFYFALGIFIFIIAIVEIKDYFWYGHKFSLFTPKRFLKSMENKMHKSNGSMFRGFALGAAAAFIGLFSTGASYLAALTLVTQPGFTGHAYIFVGLYSLVFAAPVLLIVCIAGHFTAHKRAEFLRHENRGNIRLITGIMLFASSMFVISNAMPLAFSYALEGGILIIAVMYIINRAEIYAPLRKD